MLKEHQLRNITNLCHLQEFASWSLQSSRTSYDNDLESRSFQCGGNEAQTQPFPHQHHSKNSFPSTRFRNISSSSFPLLLKFEQLCLIKACHLHAVSEGKRNSSWKKTTPIKHSRPSKNCWAGVSCQADV